MYPKENISHSNTPKDLNTEVKGNKSEGNRNDHYQGAVPLGAVPSALLFAVCAQVACGNHCCRVQT